MFSLIIQNARLLGRIGLWDVGIEDQVIRQISPANSVMDAPTRIDASGNILFPGIIDPHVHTRDPGYTHKEDTTSATSAAAVGGITTIMAMPNTNPPLTNASALRYAGQIAKKHARVNIHMVAGISSDQPWNILKCSSAGAIALDVYDDIFQHGTKAWIKLLTEVKKTDLPICFYLMDSALENYRKQEEEHCGGTEASIIQAATNGTTEEISLMRIIPLAAYFDVPVVIRMVSTKGGIDCIRRLKQQYPHSRIFAEVCVHYLYLTEKALKEHGNLAHIHPPLRTSEDIDALWDGIRDGTVDYIASDHAPHAKTEKEGPLSKCASGMIGLETMLPLLLDSAFQGKLSYEDIQRLCCKNPADIFGLSNSIGSISEGKNADLIIVDPEAEMVIGKPQYSRGVENPFVGRDIHGKVQTTILRGKVIMQDGIVL